MALEDLNYNTKELEKLRDDVLDVLDKKGRVHNHKLIKDELIEPEDYKWEESTLKKALGALREDLKEQNVIGVIPEPGEGPIKRQVWVKK